MASSEQGAYELGNLYAEEGEPILKIFPIEIWEQIFDHVGSIDDLRNIGQSYSIWQDVLTRTRAAWLFSQIFPQVWSLLSKKEILCCRRVCKRWCTAVDYFLENNEYHRPADESGNHLRRRPLIRGLRDIGVLYTPYSLVRMEKMCQVAQYHPRNPIIGRSVYVDWERIPYTYMPFLSTFGKHIWYLRVQCTQREVQPIPFLLRILDYLPYLPNLKKLELFLWEGNNHTANNHHHQGSSSACSSTEEEELDLYLSRCPVGQYPDLHTLEVEIMGHHHEKVKRVLMATFAKQIRRLSMNRYSLDMPLRNVTDLSMTAESGSQLESLLRLESPLTRLALSIVNHVNYPMAFKAIEHFGSTVRVLAVDFPTATSYSDWKRLKLPVLKMPNLKTLALKGCIPPSLNFICGLDELQYLHICDLRSSELVTILDSQTVFSDEKVQILKFLNQPGRYLKNGSLYKSNLWEVFPKMREFTFTSFVRRTPDVERRYRRDQHDRWKEVIMMNTNII